MFRPPAGFGRRKQTVDSSFVLAASRLRTARNDKEGIELLRYSCTPSVLHPQLPKQKGIYVRELFNLLRDRLSCAMPGLRLDSQQDRPLTVFAVLRFCLH